MKTQKNKNQSKNQATQLNSVKDYGKPAVESCSAGIPLSIGLLQEDSNNPKESPTLVDHETFSKSYQVQDGAVYTIRLGVHSDPHGVGAITKDSAVACMIPTAATKRVQLLAMFFIDELYPAKFADSVYLLSDNTFKLELLHKTTRLESNNESRKSLTLSDDAVRMENENILIFFNGLDEELPECNNFTYDFLTFEVRVAFEKKHMVKQRVRVVSDKRKTWNEHIHAKVGDKIEIEVSYSNYSSDTIENLIITTDIPECFRFIKDSATTDGARRLDCALMKEDDLTILRIALGECKPGTAVSVHYIMEVINKNLPDSQDGLCNWVQVSADSNVQYAYTEIFFK